MATGCFCQVIEDINKITGGEPAFLRLDTSCLHPSSLTPGLKQHQQQLLPEIGQHKGQEMRQELERKSLLNTSDGSSACPSPCATSTFNDSLGQACCSDDLESQPRYSGSQMKRVSFGGSSSHHLSGKLKPLGMHRSSGREQAPTGRSGGCASSIRQSTSSPSLSVKAGYEQELARHAGAPGQTAPLYGSTLLRTQPTHGSSCAPPASSSPGPSPAGLAAPCLKPQVQAACAGPLWGGGGSVCQAAADAGDDEVLFPSVLSCLQPNQGLDDDSAASLLEAVASCTQPGPGKRELRHSYSAPADSNKAKEVILSLVYGRYIPKDKWPLQQEQNGIRQMQQEQQQAGSKHQSRSKKQPASLNLATRWSVGSTDTDDCKPVSRSASVLGMGSTTLAEQFALIWGGSSSSSTRWHLSSLFNQPTPTPSRAHTKQSIQQVPMLPDSSGSSRAAAAPASPRSVAGTLQQQPKQFRARKKASQLSRALVSSFRFAQPRALPLQATQKKLRHSSIMLAALPAMGSLQDELDCSFLGHMGGFSQSLSDSKLPVVTSTLEMLQQAREHVSAKEQALESSMLIQKGADDECIQGASSSRSLSSPQTSCTVGGVADGGSMVSALSTVCSGLAALQQRRNSGRHFHNSPISPPLSRMRGGGRPGREGGMLSRRPGTLAAQSSTSMSGMGVLSKALVQSCSLNPDQPMCRLVPPDQLPAKLEAGLGSSMMHQLRCKSASSSTKARVDKGMKKSSSGCNITHGWPGAPDE